MSVFVHCLSELIFRLLAFGLPGKLSKIRFFFGLSKEIWPEVANVKSMTCKTLKFSFASTLVTLCCLFSSHLLFFLRKPIRSFYSSTFFISLQASICCQRSVIFFFGLNFMLMKNILKIMIKIHHFFVYCVVLLSSIIYYILTIAFATFEMIQNWIMELYLQYRTNSTDTNEIEAFSNPIAKIELNWMQPNKTTNFILCVIIYRCVFGCWCWLSVLSSY